MGRQYSISFTGTVTTTKTLVQLDTATASPMSPIEIIEINVGGNSNTSNAGEILIARTTTAGTAGTTGVCNPLLPGDAATTLQLGTATTMTMGTNGTLGQTVMRSQFNAQAGGNFFWARGYGNPTRIIVAGNGASASTGMGILSIVSNSTITSATLSGYVIFEELV